MWERRRGSRRGVREVGPVRNPVLEHRVRLISLVPLVWESNPKLQGVFITAVPVCVLITAVPITKLFAWRKGIVEDMCNERRRAEACVD